MKRRLHVQPSSLLIRRKLSQCFFKWLMQRDRDEVHLFSVMGSPLRRDLSPWDSFTGSNILPRQICPRLSGQKKFSERHSGDLGPRSAAPHVCLRFCRGRCHREAHHRATCCLIGSFDWLKNTHNGSKKVWLKLHTRTGSCFY